MKASDLFVDCLREEGVQYVFGVPGEENLDLLESLRRSDIRLIVTRHEQHAAFMAATWGRLTGRAGVRLSTPGTGATNLVPGIAHAQIGGMPLMAVTGQDEIKENRKRMGKQPGLSIEKTGIYAVTTRMGKGMLAVHGDGCFIRHSVNSDLSAEVVHAARSLLVS